MVQSTRARTLFGFGNTSRWDASDLAELTRLIRQGQSAREIAAALGRSPNAVVRKARAEGYPLSYRPGVSGTVWTRSDVDVLRAVLAGRIEEEHAAALLARSVEAIRSKARRLAEGEA